MWYISRSKRKEGPFSERALASAIHNGELGADTLVWCSGMPSWAPLRDTALAKMLPGFQSPQAMQPQAAGAFGGGYGSYGGYGAPQYGANQFIECLRDAGSASLSLAKDPFGSLHVVIDRMDDSRVLGVGAVFHAAIALLGLLYFIIASGGAGSIGLCAKVFFFSLVPGAGLTLAILLCKVIFRGQGNFGQCLFIAGAAMIWPAVLNLLFYVVGALNVEVVIVGMVFYICLPVVIVYCGMTRTLQISERAAAVAVPLAFILMFWLIKIVIMMFIREMLEELGKLIMNRIMQSVTSF